MKTPPSGIRWRAPSEGPTRARRQFFPGLSQPGCTEGFKRDASQLAGARNSDGSEHQAGHQRCAPRQTNRSEKRSQGRHQATGQSLVRRDKPGAGPQWLAKKVLWGLKRLGRLLPERRYAGSLSNSAYACALAFRSACSLALLPELVAEGLRYFSCWSGWVLASPLGSGWRSSLRLAWIRAIFLLEAPELAGSKT